MSNGSTLDLLTFDRDVRRAAQSLARARASLSTEEGRAESPNPFDLEAKQERHAAGQTAFRALAALRPAEHELPLRDALLRWVHELLQARVGWDLEVADAVAVHAVDPSLSKRAEQVTVAPSFADAWRTLVAPLHPARRDEALARLSDLAAPIVAVRRERRARRAEVAHRLDSAPTSYGLATPEHSSLTLDARALLDATEPLAAELLREARRGTGGSWTVADAIEQASARDATEGWPAQLSSRWLAEAFNGVSAVDASNEARTDCSARLPEVLSAASFLRAGHAYGYAWRLAGTARSLPFALARDPYPVDAHRFGAVFATAIADPVFQRRRLGLSIRVANAQSRVLRRSLLGALRVAAARLLLRASADAHDAFEELTTRAFGAPMPASLAGAWPEPRVDEPALFEGLLGSYAFYMNMVRRFDEDWFENPSAGAHLTAMACGPVRPLEREAPGERDANVASALARAFEKALG